MPQTCCRQYALIFQDSINLIYDFYNTIGQLKIQLQELEKQKEYSLANITVYYSAQNLAVTINTNSRILYFTTQRP